MRHVPTLYIDTEVLYRGGLRFDKGVFKTFTNVFAQGGLRLLVPKLMELELLRHFERRAKNNVTDLLMAYKKYPINIILPPSTLPSQGELEEKCIEEMTRQWTSFKKHFIFEDLPIVNNMEGVVNQYFDIIPPFSKGKRREFPDAFIISTLDQYHEKHHVNIVVISADKDFEKASADRNYIRHFKCLETYIDAFQPELSGEEELLGNVGFTKPIATEDLTKLKGLLALRGKVTLIQIQQVMKLLKSRGANYDYFFQNANDDIWLKYLSEEGYFLNPPRTEETTEGHYVVPFWPPIEYLMRISETASEKALDEISKFSDTNNLRVLQGILKIVLEVDSADAVLRFYRFITSFIESPGWGHQLIISLLRKPFIFDSKLSAITPELLLKLVEFLSDPQEQEKKSLRKENSEAWNFSLEPAPRFNQWEYQETLEKGIRPLSEDEPYQVACILIAAVANMIQLRMHSEDRDKAGDEDDSEIWCRRLDKSDRDYQDIKGTLVYTLTYACEQAYDKAPESIGVLDQTLRNQQWKVFQRLRQHLYTLHPNERTLPWIRELILGYGDYSRREYGYEFQLMVRKASEHLGSRLLNEDERSTIFNDILSGPSKEDFREWIGDRYSDEAFQERQHYFHRMQLHPFAVLLSGEAQQYFNKLKDEAQAEVITDDSYSPYGKMRSDSSFVSYRSPKSAEDLKTLKDEELLAYLNNWDEEHQDKEDWSVEINIPALADVFRSLFKEGIVSDDKRLAYWMENRDKIARHIYVEAMVKAMQEVIEEKNFDSLEQWFEFCEWVLSHPDSEEVEGQPEPQDESRNHQGWGKLRRAVVDFIDACVDKNTDAPVAAREGLSSLLQQVCSQPDWQLERGRPVLLNHDDPITEAINNTRSRALKSLVNLGFWIRRHLPKDPVPEVTDILSERMAEDARPALTRPEHALLGVHFGNLCALNRDWAVKQRQTLFPQEKLPVWLGAFGSYILYNEPAKAMFKILREDFEYALENLNDLTTKKDDNGELVSKLGQHLFAHYLLQAYSLKGDDSLLARFYDKTKDEPRRWTQLFDYVGRLLRERGEHLNKELVDRVTNYCDWRLEVGEALEPQEFTFWLEVTCLDPEWRLRSYSKILDLGGGSGVGSPLVWRGLNKLLPDHLSLVVECFAKIIDAIDKSAQIYIPYDEAKPILEAGLHAEDAQIRENAERTKEKLLQLGHFDYLDVE